MDKPIWEPGKERIDRANLSRFMRFAHEQHPHADLQDYRALYDYSIRNPEKFWTLVWDFCGIKANGEREPVLVDAQKMPGARWFPGVRLNFAQNLLRYRDDRTALWFRGESGVASAISYAELHEQVGALTAAMKARGVAMGDRVAGFMPNLPGTVIAMLATTSLGAVWSSCSPDFGIEGVVDRFGQIRPKLLFCADGYAYGGKRFDSREKIRGVLERIDSIECVVVVPYLDPAPSIDGLRNAVLLPDFVAAFQGHAPEFVSTPFDHPLYVMYSSGTTGVPKCIVHGAGGTLLQHLKELVLHTDLRRDDHIFYYTTCGWMMWNWLVSSLAVGATIVLYDGNPMHPNANALWDLADAAQVSIFGTSAKWISACEKAGVRPSESHKLTALRTILSTGSPLAPESFDYVYRDVKDRVQLSSISGGTDILSCFALGCPILPVWRGELQCRGLGMAVQILDDDGTSLRGTTGELSCVAPFPSMPIGFWDDADGSRYRAAYFESHPGVWCQGDHARLTEHDGVIIHGRSDATLNPGGVRIGTAEIYRQVERLPEVLESVCVGQDWRDDVRVVLFVHLREGIVLDDALRDRIRKQIRDNTTPRHVPAKILQVADIPRTGSGKIVELAVRDAIHGRPVRNIDALANPRALANFPRLDDDG
ncbi:MAG TPA: acetoacetate--CoA ligase [Xanthomonadaceae bacterium]|jgi:acetoacetyl-CoA synthetase|nr:acetoacetate--CoA ligase [Xanthomonadaceae bacterium]